MPQKIQVRRGTAAEWIAANPILASGEPGLESDTKKVKYGDGTTAWNNLGYAGDTTGRLCEINAVRYLNPTWNYTISPILFDGSALTGFFNIAFGTIDLIADFGSPVAITKVGWFMYYADGRSYRKIGLYGSNNGTDWTVLRTPADTVFTVDGLTITVGGEYRYLKFYSEANATYNSNDFLEIEIYSKVQLAFSL